MTDSLFEVITKEEFEESGGGTFDNVATTGRLAEPPSDLDLTWCEFCKGYYIAEYHYGRSEDESGG